MHKPESILENKTHKILWYFEIQTDHLIQARRQDLVIINKRNRMCDSIDFTVPKNQIVKIKDEKRDKYSDFARELRKLWYMTVTVSKNLLRKMEELEFGGQIETNQTSRLIGSGRVLRRFLENLGD